MAHAHPKPSLGFLTVLDDAEVGLIGGYLVLNVAGRPLEFHCTAPIKPNRAQQILYGPTLEPYLFGEQIGQTLVSKSGASPLAIYTDRRAALALREHVDVPVAWALGDGDEGSQPGGPAEANRRFDRPHAVPCGPVFRLGRNRLAVTPGSDDEALLVERMQPYVESLDLLEPFERIREAIGEARRGGPS